jgi:hypothetical protein
MPTPVTLERIHGPFVRATADPKMPLAQAHPFEPMPVTHEEEMQEVSQGERERESKKMFVLQ